MAKGKKLTEEQRQKARMVTAEFRVSFPHLFEPNAIEGSKPKYSVTMLFDKKGNMTGLCPETEAPRTLQEIMKQAKINEWGPDESTWPKKIASPVTNGDSPELKDKEGYAGHWAIKCSSMVDSKPSVVDSKLKPILNAADFYPGCYADAYIFARVWEFAGKYGVQFIVDHVRKRRDGKSLSSKKSADQVFAPLEEIETSDFSADEENDNFTY